MNYPPLEGWFVKWARHIAATEGPLSLLRVFPQFAFELLVKSRDVVYQVVV